MHFVLTATPTPLDQPTTPSTATVDNPTSDSTLSSNSSSKSARKKRKKKKSATRKTMAAAALASISTKSTEDDQQRLLQRMQRLTQACATSTSNKTITSNTSTTNKSANLSKQSPLLTPALQFSFFYQCVLLSKCRSPNDLIAHGMHTPEPIYNLYAPLTTPTSTRTTKRSSLSAKEKKRERKRNGGKNIARKQMARRSLSTSSSSQNKETASIPITMIYSPKGEMAKNNFQQYSSLVQEGTSGPFLLTATEKFPTWTTKDISLERGKWYYEFEVVNPQVKNDAGGMKESDVNKSSTKSSNKSSKGKSWSEKKRMEESEGKSLLKDACPQIGWAVSLKN
jgi:uncharacterized membrane protein YkoI